MIGMVLFDEIKVHHFPEISDNILHLSDLTQDKKIKYTYRRFFQSGSEMMNCKLKNINSVDRENEKNLLLHKYLH